MKSTLWTRLAIAANVVSVPVLCGLGFALYIYVGGVSPLHSLQSGLSDSIDAAMLSGDWTSVRTKVRARALVCAVKYVVCW